jgi:hypothetical protein
MANRINTTAGWTQKKRGKKWVWRNDATGGIVKVDRHPQDFDSWMFMRPNQNRGMGRIKTKKEALNKARHWMHTHPYAGEIDYILTEQGFTQWGVSTDKRSYEAHEGTVVIYNPTKNRKVGIYAPTKGNEMWNAVIHKTTEDGRVIENKDNSIGAFPNKKQALDHAFMRMNTI